jgi:hypothetical protein
MDRFDIIPSLLYSPTFVYTSRSGLLVSVCYLLVRVIREANAKYTRVSGLLGA